MGLDFNTINARFSKSTGAKNSLFPVVFNAFIDDFIPLSFYIYLNCHNHLKARTQRD